MPSVEELISNLDHLWTFVCEENRDLIGYVDDEATVEMILTEYQKLTLSQYVVKNKSHYPSDSSLYEDGKFE